MSKIRLFDHFTYHYVPVINPEKELILSLYDIEWITRYIEKNYGRNDYVLKRSELVRRPFVWGDTTFPELNEIQKKIFLEASDFNINSGFTFPIIDINNNYSCLTIGFKSHLSKKNITEQSKKFIEKMAYFLHVNIMSQYNKIKSNSYNFYKKANYKNLTNEAPTLIQKNLYLLLKKLIRIRSKNNNYSELIPSSQKYVKRILLLLFK